MEEPAGDNEKVESSAMRTLKHDIKNQLSNIYLALEQLRYELPDTTEDCTFYMDLISKSATKIDTILKQTE
jgi:hypothetical protein